MNIHLKNGLCGECNDGKQKPVIGKRDKALCVNHYQNRLRANSNPIEKKSDKRIDEDKIYYAVRAVFLNDNKLCVANLVGCQRRATEVHHTKGHGIYYLDVETWIPLCENCHRWLESHPNAAKALIMSQDRLTKNKAVLPFNLIYENSIRKLELCTEETTRL